MRSAMQSYAASCTPDVSIVRDGRGRFTAGPGVSRVLLAIDDVESLETVALMLAAAGVAVEAAPTADGCVRALDRGAFDLLVIDLRLGRERGLDLVRELRTRGFPMAFVLVAEQAAIAEVVEAMRLGARTVLEKTAAKADLVSAIMRELGTQGPASHPSSVSLLSGAPARRWAGHVLAATDAEADPRTLADWSRAVGVSRSVLVESCARLGIVPRDARDLARVLRLVRRRDEPWDPETALDVADRRTLRALLDRAGLTGDALQVKPSTRQFLSRQRFVAQTNPGLAALWQVIEG